ncbi:unnamed protein product [Adineta ricciae]|uniref:F-box domain-containing protein n=1 Tax=Adineta ricciae TaxID=249248 RepID=A0A815X0B5_ADIRI|nr:unnamed protein product [Adineta ricciae]CAF1550220.1 unnamed protein product [Adineta ricciae]
MTLFESFANELLLELFEYFDTVHLLRAFTCLNVRFNTLLYQHFRSYHLDFTHIYKRDFVYLCEQHLRLITNGIVSFRLTGHNETPGLFKQFLTYGYRLDQFAHLQAMSFNRFDYGDIIEFLGKGHQLTHLIIDECNMFMTSNDSPHSINQIWNLPKLTHFKLTNCYLQNIDFCRLAIISNSLQCLSIRAGLGCSFSTLMKICQCSPCLQHLSICIELDNESEKLPIVLTTLSTLELQLCNTSSVLQDFLHNVPNLRHLTVDSLSSHLNGHEWQEIIVEYMPKLTVLQFKMLVYTLSTDKIDKEIADLLDTFRIPFWLEQHQWYVRCDWNSDIIGSRYGYLYTLPFAFDSFTETTCQTSQWTGPSNEISLSYKYVHNLFVGTSLHLHSAYFSNVREIKTTIPLPNQFTSTVLSFNSLIALKLFLYDEHRAPDLQTILNQTPHLYALTIEDRDASALRFVSKLRCASLRRLIFIPRLTPDVFFFDDMDCIAFAQSSLAHQCEVLEIYVKSYASAVNVVQAMPNLRALTLYISDDEFPHVRHVSFSQRMSSLWRKLYACDGSTSKSSDLSTPEMIKWLKTDLSKRCWTSISSGWNGDFYLKFWGN